MVAGLTKTSRQFVGKRIKKEIWEEGKGNMELAEQIRYFRSRSGLSREELAERTGIHANTLGKYESGRRKPKIEQLKRIADGLGISVIEFLDIEIENEADLAAVLKKVSPFFRWEGLARLLGGEDKL